MFVCRDIRVNAGAPEKIACNNGLIGKVVPQLEGKGWICCAEATNEVVFKSLYSPFGCIHPMIVGFDQLNCASFVVHEGPDGGCCLIVGDVKLWSVTSLCQNVVCLFECGEDIVVAGGCDWKSEDVIGVVVVGDKEKVLSVEGARREAASAVGVECAVLFVCESCTTEKIGVSVMNAFASGAVEAGRTEFEAAFSCRW